MKENQETEISESNANIIAFLFACGCVCVYVGKSSFYAMITHYTVGKKINDENHKNESSKVFIQVLPRKIDKMIN